MDKIIIVYHIFVNKNLIRYTKVSKEINESITIGRNNKNDIDLNFPTISKEHGRVFSENKILYYEDKSKHGSTIIHWNRFEAVSEFVNKRIIELKKDDWVIISESGVNSILIMPIIE